MYELNLLLLISDAIANNKKMHSVIDEVYSANEVLLSKYDLREKAIKNDFGSIEFQKYFLRTLRILKANKEEDDDINIIGIEKFEYTLTKEYSYEYTYIDKLNGDEFNLDTFLAYFTKKVRNKKITDNEFNWHAYIALFFALNSGFKIVDCQTIRIVIGNYNNYYNNGKGIEGNPFLYNNIVEKQDKEILRLLNEKLKFIKQSYPNINYNSALFVLPVYAYSPGGRAQLTLKQKDMLSIEYIYDRHLIDLNAISKYKGLTNKEITELLFMYYKGHFDEFSSDDALKEWFSYSVPIYYLTKAYRDAKNFYYDNSNNLLLDKIKALESELDGIQAISKKYATDNSTLLDENELLKKEVQRLKQENENLKNDKLEINSLRDFIFSLEHSENDIKTDIDLKVMIDAVNENKLLIIGGTDSWIRKMKETLNQCTFISPDVTFDNKVLLNKNVVINTDHIGHGTYYRLIENIDKMKSFRFFSNATNIELSIKKLYKLVK